MSEIKFTDPHLQNLFGEALELRPMLDLIDATDKGRVPTSQYKPLHVYIGDEAADEVMARVTWWQR